jgi:DNA-binding NtrC family response regulator
LKDKEKRSILIIDDDALLCASLVDALGDSRTEVTHAQTGADGINACREQRVDVVLLDQHLPDTTGETLCPEILALHDRAKVVFMTAYPTFENAVAALKLGASDYLSKPFELEELHLAVANAFRVQELERIEQLHSRRLQRDRDRTVLIGATGGLRETLRLAELAAVAGAPVLITGETGTGKSLLARHIHYSGPRREQDFVSINCGALPESLAESELFGHEKGAFTGALSARRGVFEMAEGGSVFLDEIGAMPIHQQAKLLGVLEDRVVRRVGGERSRTVDVRVIAATNTDLAAAVEAGDFRRDLFYRLGVMHIDIPPLRQRCGDIPDLCRHLLTTVSGQEITLADDELARLAAYHWPGNVRELRNILERAVIVQAGRPLSPSELLTGGSVEAAGDSTGSEETGILPLQDVEDHHIRRALTQFGGNYTQTAKALGIALSTLKRKAKQLGI